MKRSVVWLGMSLLVLTSLYPLIRQSHSAETAPLVDNAHEPDIIIYHSVTHHYSALGLLKNTLFAEKTEYFKNDRRTLVTHPLILGYRNQVLYWKITADQGESLQNPDEIVLRGHVAIYQPKTETNPETTITTESLTYYPKLAKVTTDQAVLIRQPESRFSAVGMEFNLKTGTLVAHANSRGRYALK